MKRVSVATFWLVISWVFSVIFAMVAVAVYGMGGRLQRSTRNAST